jgi:hypothetical protein
VQEGHSHSEQAVYAALWDKGKLSPDGNRIVTMGLGKLAQTARLSLTTCRLNVRSLVKKLAVEEIRAEDSRAGIGKSYRIYSYSAILERRRAAGLEFVVRTKGVVFVDPQSGAEVPLGPTVGLIPGIVSTPGPESAPPPDSAPGSDYVPGGDADSVAPPPPVSASHNRNSLLETRAEAAASSLLIERIGNLGVVLDDDAALQIVAACLAMDHAATIEEITHFSEIKVNQLAKRPVRNLPGMLITAVPAFFNQPATELSRYRETRRKEIARERELIESILADPQAGEQERAWARSFSVAGRERR